MFYLGTLDVFNILANASLTGYLLFVGAVPCSYIDFIYLAGAFELGMWANQCCTCAVLLVNRCAQLVNADWPKYSFLGKRAYIWIAMCVTYGLTFSFFANALVFSSTSYAWFFDPYIDIPELNYVDKSYYKSTLHTANNIGVILLLVGLNTVLMALIKMKRGANTRFGRVQTLITIQSFVICLFTISSSLIFVIDQHFRVPTVVTIASNFSWQLSNAGPGIMYIAINRTIRNGVLSMINKKIGWKASSKIYSITRRDLTQW
ncbi:hypothetical protein QR680_015658 [Steinernema hermaphroditum]|uniref:7TM GPCR serpentine receptor class x (Srx) domain-containing protein n=1 Tax=Steinernema hermaphroditum TaxID=289476 RepID=A0AA39HAG4_9BILA|nr:hypothetical protein QR680_015658 [Steinernema hermaphroditum]